MPGKKIMEGETPTEALARLLHGACAPLAHEIIVTNTEQQVSWMESKRMEVTTKYVRTVNHARLGCTVESLGLEQACVCHPPGMGHRTSRRSNTSIFAVNAIGLFSWLNMEDFNFYTSSDGEAALQTMLDQVSLDARTIAAAKDAFACAQPS